MENSSRVLVTGGTGTLGAALVESLTDAKYEVMANFRRDTVRALHLQQKTGCALHRGDVGEESAVENLFSGQKYRAVFHLAALSCDALLPRVSTQNWQAQLQTNLQSAFLVTRAALQHLPRGGNLILVASRVAERGFVGQSAYGASKAAMLGLMKTAALEGHALGIRVNAICPGFTPSALSETLSNRVLAARNAQNYIVDADAAQSFAALCVWLLQTSAPISGEILRPDCRI